MNKYLVQYNPITGTIGRYIRISDLNCDKGKIEKFYEDVNASDYYHKTIVIYVDVDNNKIPNLSDGITKEIMETMGIIYRRQ